MKYESKTRAKQAQEGLDSKSLGWCPVIKAKCTKFCVCYRESVVITLADVYEVTTPYCDHLFIKRRLN